MTNLVKIADELSELKIVEVSELVKMLEERWGVSASVAVAAAPVADGQSAGATEKSSFEVILTNPGASKINIIKLVKDICNLGLQEAKAIVDAAPKAIKSNVNKEEAETIKKKFEEAGASIELK